MTTENELDARLASADRAAALKSHDAALALTFADAEAVSRSVWRRRRFVRAGIAGALVIGLGVTAPAASAAIRDYLAQTGEYCSGGTECGNNPTLAESEVIESWQSDFPEYVDSVFPVDSPLPPGLTRADVVDELLGNIKQNNELFGPSAWQSGALSSGMEHMIYCGWIDEWLDANAGADLDSQQAAAAAMRDAATWRGVVMSDGGGIADGMVELADAADRGDAEPIARESQINCHYEYAPAP